MKTSIQYIKDAANKLVDSKLQKLGAAKTQEIFRGVMQSVGLETMEEVYLFVAQFDLTCRDRTSNMDDLSSYFKCSSLDMLEYIPALKSLERKGLLVRRRRREENIFKQDFAVNDSVMAAIIENQAVKISDINVEKVQIDKYEFCKQIADQVEDSDVVTDDLVKFVEKLEGILIATTNLADNLDGAFERRFLFKIKYDKPTTEAKKNFLMSKMPMLSEEDAQFLASKYEFSGGQIDNIVRKALMQEVIMGEKPTINSLVALCGEEYISKKGTGKIGFY